MNCFKPNKPERELRAFREEYRKLLRRERRFYKLIRQLQGLLGREIKRHECEEVPTISF